MIIVRRNKARETIIIDASQGGVNSTLYDEDDFPVNQSDGRVVIEFPQSTLPGMIKAMQQEMAAIERG